MRSSAYAPALVRLRRWASTPCAALAAIVFAAVVLVEQRPRAVRGADALYRAACDPEPGAMREAIAGLEQLDARDHCGFTPLALMASYGRRDAVEVLLGRGAAVDVPHPLLGTPLMLALRSGNADVARALLERGADANARCAGYDPLASAAAGNNVDCVRLVLAAGADPHAPGRRFSVLTLAVQASESEVMRELLAAGVAPNAPDADGTTPLINAVESDATECARLLLAAGADPSRVAPDGRTPREVARQRGCRGMLELLESVER